MSADQWVAVTPMAALGDGKMLGTQAGGLAVAVYNVDGCFYATSDICTHGHAHLSDGWFEGGLIECPLHAGQFDVKTGKGMGPPITCDIRTFPIRIVDGSVEVCVSDTASG